MIKLSLCLVVAVTFFLSAIIGSALPHINDDERPFMKYLRTFVKSGTPRFSPWGFNGFSRSVLQSRPVRRLGSEFLGKRSLNYPADLQLENETIEKDVKDGDLSHLQEQITSFSTPEIESTKATTFKRDLEQTDHDMKTVFKKLLKSYARDLFNKRMSNRANSGLSFYGGSEVGSEFLGKRTTNDEQVMETEGPVFDKRAMGSEFLGKRAMGSEFLGKRAMGSEFLGKRAMGSEFLGKRAMGSEFLGKRAMGSEFLGKRAMGSEFLGKRAMGSEFLGKRAMGSEFLGKRAMGSEFLGKRAMGSEFLGKRAMGSEFLGKRAMGSEFLGKRRYDKADLMDENTLKDEVYANIMVPQHPMTNENNYT